MPGEDFDFDAASDSIGADLGFGSEGGDDGDDLGLGGAFDGANGGSGSDNRGVAGSAPAGGATDPSAAPAAGVPGATPPAAGDPNATPAPAPDANVPQAPRTWRPEAAAEFSKLPPVVQAEIAKREEDIFKGIEQYKVDAEFGRSLKPVLDPYLPILQQYGIKPEAQVQDMMQSHYILAFGTPEQKADMVQRVFRDYKLDPAAIFGQQPAGGDTPAYVDPQVEALQNQLKELKTQLNGFTSQQQQAKAAEVQRHVEAFAADPKNVHFVELANDIAHYLRTGACKTVEEAYEKAMWTNPAVRTKELERQQREKTEADRKAAEEKTAAAAKAKAANVRTKAKSGSAAAPVGSMDDTLNETLAKIMAKG